MTINIYDSGGGSEHIEFLNNGDNDVNVMPIVVRIGKDEYFNLSKDDARELIRYLKKEFKFVAAEFQ